MEAISGLYKARGTRGKAPVSGPEVRAGVQRLTVYRHFPDEHALPSACSSHYGAAYPLPDPWTRIADADERLRRALAETYAYHDRTEPMMSKVLRDSQVHAPTSEATVPYLRHWDRTMYTLVAGWGPGPTAQETAGGARSRPGLLGMA